MAEPVKSTSDVLGRVKLAILSFGLGTLMGGARAAFEMLLIYPTGGGASHSSMHSSLETMSVV